jgi:hypothetical protein
MGEALAALAPRMERANSEARMIFMSGSKTRQPGKGNAKLRANGCTAQWFPV